VPTGPFDMGAAGAAAAEKGVGTTGAAVAPVAGEPRHGNGARPGAPTVEIGGCPVPEDRLYDLDQDVWLRRDEGGETATVGLLGPLAWFAGPFVHVAFRDVSGPVARGRSVATVESVRYTGAVRLPVEAQIVDRNLSIVDRPRLLNDTPYDEGWVVRIRPTTALGASVPGLGTAAEIAGPLRARIAAQRIRCWPQTPDVQIYEIGIECSAVLTMLNDELRDRPPGTAVLLVTDDPTSPIEMERWADQTGHALLARRTEGTLHHFLVRKEANPVPRRRRPTT
jgi:glycine cleavage system H protein